MKLRIVFLSLLVAIVFFIYYHYNPSEIAFFPSCPTKTFLKMDCPFCGSQRAFHHLLHGDFSEAFHYNPMLFIGIPLLMIVYLFKRSWLGKNWFLLLVFVILLLYFLGRNIEL